MVMTNSINELLEEQILDAKREGYQPSKELNKLLYSSLKKKSVPKSANKKKKGKGRSK